MTDAFQPGDLVQLKSGGPIMTVDETVADGVWAIWFAYGKRHRRRFVTLCLQGAVSPKARRGGTVPCTCASA
jgi:uncharacterized protein YodC (DUF2158 family)